MADQVTLINVSNFEKQTFNTQDTKIIPNKEYSSQYDIINDSIEVYIYDLNKDLISFDYNYKHSNNDKRAIPIKLRIILLNQQL